MALDSSVDFRCRDVLRSFYSAAGPHGGMALIHLILATPVGDPFHCSIFKIPLCFESACSVSDGRF
jgi:hypothetical protein